MRFLQLFKSEHKVILHKTQSLIFLLARLELGLVLVDFQSFVLHLLHQLGSLLGLGLRLLSLLLKILSTGSMELSLVQLDLDLLLKLSLLLVMVLRLGIEVLLEHRCPIPMII